jgi:nucleoside-diphosphate-sugar epimerase
LPALAKGDRELAQIEWSLKVTPHFNCTTPTPTSVGEVADAVFAAYGLDANKAEHIWITAMADSKSESNALELIEKGVALPYWGD